MFRALLMMALTFGIILPANAETREESAARLIAQGETIKKQAVKLHGQAETSISGANRLRAQAHSLLLKAGTPQFNSAVAQYSGDLAQFKAHADQYNAHLEDFRKTIGECHAGEAAYENNLKGYQLHVDLFHIPNMASLRPPHICGRLDMSQGEMAHAANSMRMDQIKVLEAEQKLNEEQTKLLQAQNAELLNSKKAVNANMRAQREQALAGEFGKLKEEYDLLKMENQALGGAKSKVVADIGAATSVHARVQSH